MNVYLFDIDGTLGRSGGAGKAAMEAGLASAFGVKDGFADISESGRTARARPSRATCSAAIGSRKRL